jgi:hypothetical protein
LRYYSGGCFEELREATAHTWAQICCNLDPSQYRTFSLHCFILHETGTEFYCPVSAVEGAAAVRFTNEIDFFFKKIDR